MLSKVTREEARAILEPITPTLITALDESQAALQALLDPKPEMHQDLDSSTQASILSNIFAARVAPRLRESGIKWNKNGKLQHGCVGDKIDLRFKKLTTDLSACQTQTLAQEKMYNQGLWSTEPYTHVIFGYVLDPTGRRIADAFYVCPKSWTSNHWTWSLLNGDGDGGGLFDDVSPAPEVRVVDPDLDVTVSLKPAKEKRA